jgi:hypothetical protein
MADEKKEKWVMGVALTTTILAVCAAISSLRAGSYSTRIQIFTTKEANSWAYYQSKSIKEHNFRLQRDVFRLQQFLEEGMNPNARNYVEERVKEYDKEVSRYEKEKDEIKKEAESLIEQQEVLKQHNSNFALAVMLLQIAILMSSVAALIRRKPMWFVGLAFGVFGLVYMANGFFLWF